jgi:hypothetical protein
MRKVRTARLVEGVQRNVVVELGVDHGQLGCDPRMVTGAAITLYSGKNQLARVVNVAWRR